LQERYRGIGYAKLAVMLTLPAAVNEELSGNYSKAEILAVKEEVDAEKNITDLEVMMEPKKQSLEEKGLFEKVMYQLGHDEPELYIKLFDVFDTQEYGKENSLLVNRVLDVLAPTGEAIYSVRISGEGRKMLSLKGKEADPVIIDIRTDQKESCSWDEFLDCITCNQIGMEEAVKSWEMVYEEVFPVREEKKNTEVAPVQQNRNSKVTKAKVKKNEEKPKKPENTKAEPVCKEVMQNESKEDIRTGDSTDAVTAVQTGTSADISDREPENMPFKGKGEEIPEDFKGRKETFEAGSGKDDKQRTVEQLFREGDKTAGAVYDYFIDTEIEDVRAEELLGMKAKINTLDMIMDQLIVLCRDMKGEE